MQRLSTINDCYEDAVRSGDFHRIHETNDRFHTELFGLCGNALLVCLINNYMELTYAIRGAAFADPENLDKSRDHHRIMLRLLSGTEFLGACPDLRGPHSDHQGTVPVGAPGKCGRVDAFVEEETVTSFALTPTSPRPPAYPTAIGWTCGASLLAAGSLSASFRLVSAPPSADALTDRGQFVAYRL